MDVNEVLLPGVGLRHEFTNADGERLGVIARRTGDFELVAYPEGDPDEGRPLFRLTPEEADTVAEILGAPRIAERLADLTKEMPGSKPVRLTCRPRQNTRACLLVTRERARGPGRRSSVARR